MKNFNIVKYDLQNKDYSNIIYSDYKTNLTINDLEANKLVDVKYGGNQKQQMYRAKIVQINTDNNTILVHYLGWNNRYFIITLMNKNIYILNINFTYLKGMTNGSK
jgi:hypothetical protein